MIDYFGLSDIGLYRKENQDSYLIKLNANGDLLALVCDGIGGSKAGDVASGETVKYFAELFEQAPIFNNLAEAKDYLLTNLKHINSIIFDLANKYPEFSGMGTTITGILITKMGILSINAGDSRSYGFLDEKLFHLTKDDTLVNMLLEKGEITYEESLNHPKKHYLVRALGVYEEVVIDVHEVKNMERFILCSDGLCGYVDDLEILQVIKEQKDCNIACQKLLELTLMKGGYDNVTIVVINNYENC